MQVKYKGSGATCLPSARVANPGLLPDKCMIINNELQTFIIKTL